MKQYSYGSYAISHAISLSGSVITEKTVWKLMVPRILKEVVIDIMDIKETWCLTASNQMGQLSINGEMVSW